MIDKLAGNMQTPVARPFKIFHQSSATILVLGSYIVLMIAAFGLREDWPEQRLSTAYSLELLLCIILIFGAGISAMVFSVPRNTDHTPSRLLPWISLVMGIVIWISGDIKISDSFNSAQNLQLSIMSLGVISSALPVACFLLWQIRQGYPTQLGFVSCMALLSASATGYIIMRVTHQSESFADIFIWCYSPILLVGLFGIALPRTHPK